MTRFVGLDVSQRLTWICVVDDIGRRLLAWPLRAQGLDITCLDARHASAALKMQMTRPTRTTPKGWRRSCAPDGIALCT